MPVSSAASAFAGWLFTSGTTAYTIAKAVAYVAITAAISYGSSMLMSGPRQGRQRDEISRRLNMYRDSLPPRRLVYGEVRLSGPISYMDTTRYASGDDTEDVLHYEVVMAAHEIESYQTIYLNDEEVTSLSSTSNDAWPNGDTNANDPDGIARYRPGGTLTRMRW